MSNKETWTKKIVTAAIGGITLFLATIVLNAFVSTPPTRAEFDSFKSTIDERSKSIDHRLQNIETDQKQILRIVLKQGEKR